MTHRTCTHTLVFAPPMARSALGSLSEGAGSPNGLTEGVCYVEWYKPLISAVSVGVANLATRAAKPPWLP